MTQATAERMIITDVPDVTRIPLEEIPPTDPVVLRRVLGGDEGVSVLSSFNSSI